MRGRSGPPTATTVACVEPETAPNMVQAPAVAMASPPRRWPTKAMTRSISRFADWPRVMISAAKMNIGTAIRLAGRMPARICWTIVSSWPKPPNSARNPISAPVSSGIIIGKPISKRAIIVPNMAQLIIAQTSSSVLSS